MHRIQPTQLSPLRSTLIQLCGRNDELRLAHRLHIVLLVSVGHTCAEVASWFGCHTRTVERWARRYDQGGLADLCQQRRKGRSSRLDERVAEGLAHEVASVPWAQGHEHQGWTGKLLMRHLGERYGICLGERQCQRLLRKLASNRDATGLRRLPTKAASIIGIDRSDV